MYEMKRAKSALNTQQSLVGRAVCRFHIHDLVILYHQIILTAGSTVGTGRQNLFTLPTWYFLRFLATSAPVGHTAAQLPQDSQSVSFQSGPNGASISVLVPILLLCRVPLQDTLLQVLTHL